MQNELYMENHGTKAFSHIMNNGQCLTGDGGTSLPTVENREAAEPPMYKCISQGALLPVLKNMDGDTKKGAASPLTLTADSTFDNAADNSYTSHEDEVDDTCSYCDRGSTDAAFVDSQEHADQEEAHNRDTQSRLVTKNFAFPCICCLEIIFARCMMVPPSSGNLV